MDEEDAGGGIAKSPIRRLGSTRKLLIFNSKREKIINNKQHAHCARFLCSYIIVNRLMRFGLIATATVYIVTVICIISLLRGNRFMAVAKAGTDFSYLVCSFSKVNTNELTDYKCGAGITQWV
jgi:hypothetical protein